MPPTARSRPIRTAVTRAVAAAVLVASASAVAGAYWLVQLLGPARGEAAALLFVVGVAIAAAGFCAWRVRRLLEEPLQQIVAATEAIADGDVARRVPDLHGAGAELAALAASVNRMTQQLVDAQTQRARVEKLVTVGRLAAGIAHEVGNPLAAINNYSYVLRTRLESAARAAELGGGTRSAISTAVPGAVEALDAMERETSRIDRIVRGLLEYARPRHVTPKPVDVNAILDGTLSLLRDQGITRRVTVRAELDRPTPVIFAERHELEQVFVNLMLNAVDAMQGIGQLSVRARRVVLAELRADPARRASDAPDVYVPHAPNRRVREWLASSDRPTQALQIVIADSGPGVPAEDEEQIFDPFFTTKPAGQGTGLGLAIVARTVGNLGGTVWVQRAREGGAAFVILLPLLAPSAMMVARSTEESLASAPEHDDSTITDALAEPGPAVTTHRESAHSG
jgi:signal transduction histidine kinase